MGIQKSPVAFGIEHEGRQQEDQMARRDHEIVHIPNGPASTRFALSSFPFRSMR